MSQITSGIKRMYPERNIHYISNNAVFVEQKQVQTPLKLSVSKIITHPNQSYNSEYKIRYSPENNTKPDFQKMKLSRRKKIAPLFLATRLQNQRPPKVPNYHYQNSQKIELQQENETDYPRSVSIPKRVSKLFSVKDQGIQTPEFTQRKPINPIHSLQNSYRNDFNNNLSNIPNYSSSRVAQSQDCLPSIRETNKLLSKVHQSKTQESIPDNAEIQPIDQSIMNPKLQEQNENPYISQSPNFNNQHLLEQTRQFQRLMKASIKQKLASDNYLKIILNNTQHRIKLKQQQQESKDLLHNELMKEDQYRCQQSRRSIQQQKKDYHNFLENQIRIKQQLNKFEYLSGSNSLQDLHLNDLSPSYQNQPLSNTVTNKSHLKHQQKIEEAVEQPILRKSYIKEKDCPIFNINRYGIQVKTFNIQL